MLGNLQRLLEEAIEEKRQQRLAQLEFDNLVKKRLILPAVYVQTKVEQQEIRVRQTDGAQRDVQQISTGAIALGNYVPRLGRNFADALPHIPRAEPTSQATRRQEIVKVPVLYLIKVLDAEGQLQETQVWLGGDRPPMLLKSYPKSVGSKAITFNGQSASDTETSGLSTLFASTQGGSPNVARSDISVSSPPPTLTRADASISESIEATESIEIEWSANYSLSAQTSGAANFGIGSDLALLVGGFQIFVINVFVTNALGLESGRPPIEFVISYYDAATGSYIESRSANSSASGALSGVIPPNTLFGLRDLGLFAGGASLSGTPTDPGTKSIDSEVETTITVRRTSSPRGIYLSATPNTCWAAIRYWQSFDVEAVDYFEVSGAIASITTFDESIGSIEGNPEDWRRSLLTLSSPLSSDDACIDAHRSNAEANLWRNKLYALFNSADAELIKLSGGRIEVVEQVASVADGACQLSGSKSLKASVQGLARPEADIIAIAPYKR